MSTSINAGKDATIMAAKNLSAKSGKTTTIMGGTDSEMTLNNKGKATLKGKKIVDVSSKEKIKTVGTKQTSIAAKDMKIKGQTRTDIKDVKLILDSYEWKKYVADGATIKCMAGSKTVKLKVTNNRTVRIKNKKIATLLDFASLVNVKSFGMCKILTATVPANGVNKPCVCALVSPWLGSRMMVNLKAFTPLLENSKLMCTIGGLITIKNPI